MAYEEGDFIKIDYVGTVKDSGEIFDTTKQEEADKEGLQYEDPSRFKPMVVCLGQDQVLDGLDKELQGKEEGKYTIELEPEEAFGKKKSDLLKLIPKGEFKSKEVDPYPGLELTIDGQRGTVRSVSGGRVIVDFNHPLASKELIYEVEILGEVEDVEEQVNSFLENLGIPNESLTVEDGEATIMMEQPLPEQITNQLKEQIEEAVDVEVTFTSEQAEDEETAEEEKE